MEINGVFLRDNELVKEVGDVAISKNDYGKWFMAYSGWVDTIKAYNIDLVFEKHKMMIFDNCVVTWEDDDTNTDRLIFTIVMVE